MRPNRLRELLDAGKPSVGTHALISWPGVVELIGQTGQYDYVEFVAEYAPYDLYALENFGRAVDLFDNFSAMMKIEQDPRTYLAVRAIGSGIQNLLFADVRTPEDARECVQAVRAESPSTGGLHGVGMRRDVGYVLEAGTPAFIEALERAVVMLMIEKEEAVRRLDEVLGVGGIDMVQFGPSDYAMSIGKAGAGRDPAVTEAEHHVIKTALSMGIQPRAEMGSPDDAKRYLDMGVRHFCMGTDVNMLYNWWLANGEALHSILDGA
jgi:2-keto-3-deoxy-L-rhamnonate aldolase RhmA